MSQVFVQAGGRHGTFGHMEAAEYYGTGRFKAVNDRGIAGSGW